MKKIGMCLVMLSILMLMRQVSPSFAQASPVTCGGTVWRDDNNDGIRDSAEPLVPGVGIELYDANGLLTTTVTDIDGKWTADVPPAQKLRLQVTEPLPSALIEGAGSGFVVFTDSDNCANVDFATLLISACSNLDVEIGDRLWFDKNGNGLQEIGEPGISGVTVNLYRDNQLVATTVTDNDGRWGATSADGLLPLTDYTVRLDHSADYATGGPLFETFLSPAYQGTDPQLDSKATAGSDGFYEMAVSTGSGGVSRHQYDMGITPPASIGNLVWLDLNGNGVKDTYPINEYPQLRGYSVPTDTNFLDTLTRHKTGRGYFGSHSAVVSTGQ